MRTTLFLLLASISIMSCSKSDEGAAEGWPNLPVKSDLYIHAAGGIKKVNLSNGKITQIGGSEDRPDQSRAVDVSMDGQEIAFIYYGYSSDNGTVREIRIMNESGQRIESLPLDDSYNLIKISPDKSKFACKKMTENTIAIFKRDGSTLGGYNNVISAAWTPDGRIVLTNLGGEIYVSNADFSSGNVIANLGSPVRDLDVSRDGLKIAFYNSGNVWTIGIDGSNLQQITESSLECFMPSWSRDGKYLSLLWDANQEGNHLSTPNVFFVPADKGIVEVSENSSDAVMLYERWPTHDDDIDYTEMLSRSQPILR